MKADVLSLEGEKKGEITLGRAFSTPVRTDVIRRVFLAEAAMQRQPYGADPLAGKRTSAHYHGLRGYRYSMMNREMARMKRIHNQGFLNMRARFVPQATKGRKAHPPKVEKVWRKKVNKKEALLGLVSAISATANKDIVKTNMLASHSKGLPIIMDNSFQDLKKTSDVVKTLGKLGLNPPRKKKIRPGKGKSRGRKYRRPKGPLIIVEKGAILKACPPNAESVQVKDLTVQHLAPGGQPGRLCIWTESSIDAAGKLGGKE